MNRRAFLLGLPAVGLVAKVLPGSPRSDLHSEVILTTKPQSFWGVHLRGDGDLAYPLRRRVATASRRLDPSSLGGIR